MAYFEWEPGLNTGIETIDNQHRKIVDYINELHDAIAEKNNEQTGIILEELIDYTVTHFTFEEGLMERGNYYCIDAHKKVHESFTNRVREYQHRYNKGEDVSRKLLSELRVWLTNHIKRDDNDYVPSVRASLDQGWISGALNTFFGRFKKR